MDSKVKYFTALIFALLFPGACTTAEQSSQVDCKPISVKIQRVESTSYQIPVRVTGLSGLPPLR